VTPKDRFSPFEFGLVICTAFGWYIVAAVSALVGGLGGGVEASDSGTTYGDAHLLGVALYEGLITPVLAAILHTRGWRIADFRPGISLSTTALGVAMFIAAFALFWLIGILLSLVFPAAQSAADVGTYMPSTAPTFTTVVLVSMVNPVFEEAFVCAYVIEALSPRFGVTTAVNVSVVIRASYHLYQGIPAFPFHAAYGLLQAYTYVRYGKLWPLVVSHAILDFIAFVRFV
jgi:membrane protease YdiL (CAAX protease family)